MTYNDKLSFKGNIKDAYITVIFHLLMSSFSAFREVYYKQLIMFVFKLILIANHNVADAT